MVIVDEIEIEESHVSVLWKKELFLLCVCLILSESFAVIY